MVRSNFEILRRPVRAGEGKCCCPLAGGTGSYGRPGRLDPQGLPSGDGRLFVRPYDMAVVPLAGAAFEGRVTRIHGLGPARRIEVALHSEAGAVIEIDVPRSGELAPGQTVGLKPRTYRIFGAAQ